jgi:hypothetical protein
LDPDPNPDTNSLEMLDPDPSPDPDSVNKSKILPGFSNGIVFGVEFVKSMKSVAVLKKDEVNTVLRRISLCLFYCGPSKALNPSL